MTKPSLHKQERAMVTRQQLMKAAREVFTRDGFESTRIEEIAARAGKTRGAFYDNFKDKEDVFFAIFEEDIARDQERVIEEMSAAADLDQRIDILARHLEELLRDKQRILLNLEFKMYVIQHPQKRKRLIQLHQEMSLRCSMMKINTLFPELVGAAIEKRRQLSMEVGAVIDGLALNSLFNPEALTGEQRRRYLRIAANEALKAAREE
ncbi:MAG: helix-turn-helix transcriptional regulator [Acidobacteria bacterium]|nr:helix-turn-helix transcriptional regulator [Acidobacteriota bacterium]